MKDTRAGKHRVTVDLPVDLYDRVKAEAKRMEARAQIAVPVSAALRSLLRRGLEASVEA